MNDTLESLVLNVRGGARLCVPAVVDLITPYVLLEQEDWFEEEIRFLRRWLRPGMRAIDVGASYGVYTVAMARAVGNGGRVWAFEPTPDTSRYLRRNLQLNECTQAIAKQAAVSDREGAAALAIDANPELNAIERASDAAREVLQVEAVTIDGMAAESDWNGIDLIKLDIEGHEPEAILGGVDFLASSSPLVMFEIQNEGGRAKQVIELLAAIGYEIFRLLPGPLALTPFDGSESHDLHLLNLFACKGDRAQALAAGGFLVTQDGIDLSSPPRQAWIEYALAAPYACGLAERWQSKGGLRSGAGAAAYLEGLAAFAQSRRAASPVNERVAWLDHAYRCVAEALDASDTLAKQLSYARLAWELGCRGAAMGALRQVVERVVAEGAVALEEPFLAPTERLEALGTGKGAIKWLKCAAVEQFEKLRAFSSLFGGPSSLGMLGSIAELPYCSAEMHRRRELMRMAFTHEQAGEPSALLCALSGENLNPRFWSGAERIALGARAGR